MKQKQKNPANIYKSIKTNIKSKKNIKKNKKEEEEEEEKKTDCPAEHN